MGRKKRLSYHRKNEYRKKNRVSSLLVSINLSLLNSSVPSSLSSSEDAPIPHQLVDVPAVPCPVDVPDRVDVPPQCLLVSLPLSAYRRSQSAGDVLKVCKLVELPCHSIAVLFLLSQ